MDLVLITLGQAVAGLLSIITSPLTAGITQTASRSTQVGTGTTKILIHIMGQIPEQQFQILGTGTEEDQVTGRTMEVGDAGTVFFPQIHQRAQVLGAVVQTGGLGNTNGMEMLYARKLFRHVGITTNNTTTITENTNDTAVLPMGDPIFV